jgi:PAS domain S-box-containing protein
METSGRNHERAVVAAAPRGSASSIRDLPESLFRTVIETANEGVWMIDASGTTTFANARMAAMLGLSASDMLGKPALNVVYPDDLSIAGLVIPATLAGDAQEFQVRFLRADGSIIPMLGGSAPFRDADGKVLGAIATLVI